MRQRRRVTQAIRSGPLVAGRRRSWFSHFCVGRSVDADGVFSMCVCVSFLFLECPFFSWWATPVPVPGGHTTGKKGQLVFFFFLLFIKSHYWEDCRPYKESHRRDGSVCVCVSLPSWTDSLVLRNRRRKILFFVFSRLIWEKRFFLLSTIM
jgi:hypothetical protein